MDDASNEPIKIIFAWVVEEDDIRSLIDDLFDGVLQENRNVNHHLGQFIADLHLLLVDLENQTKQEVSADRSIDIIYIHRHSLYVLDSFIKG